MAAIVLISNGRGLGGISAPGADITEGVVWIGCALDPRGHIAPFVEPSYGEAHNGVKNLDTLLFEPLSGTVEMPFFYQFQGVVALLAQDRAAGVLGPVPSSMFGTGCPEKNGSRSAVSACSARP
jgi:hypothetical protein